jgi:hypothetical protein
MFDLPTLVVLRCIGVAYINPRASTRHMPLTSGSAPLQGNQWGSAKVVSSNEFLDGVEIATLMLDAPALIIDLWQDRLQCDVPSTHDALHCQ